MKIQSADLHKDLDLPFYILDYLFYIYYLRMLQGHRNDTKPQSPQIPFSNSHIYLNRSTLLEDVWKIGRKIPALSYIIPNDTSKDKIYRKP